MKKKILIKEADLKKLVPKLLEDVIKEYDITPNNQLELDFEEPVGGSSDTLVSLMEERYQEISEEINNELNLIKSSGWNDSIYNNLDSIHSNKIFPLFKELDSISDTNQRLDELVEDFNALEDVLVTCLEMYKEWKTLDDELNNTVGELSSLLQK